MSVTKFDDRIDGATRVPNFNRAAKNISNRQFADFMCASGLLLADIVAIVAACAVSAVIAEVSWSPRWEWQARLWASLPELAVTGALALIYLILHGHYTRRLPFWTDSRKVVEVSLFATLATCFMDLALGGDASIAVLAGTWILFPAASMATRRLARHVLSWFGVWEITVLVIGDDAASDDLYQVLRSEKSLGYDAVGFLSIDQIAMVRGQRYFSQLMETYGASRLILATTMGSESNARTIRDIVRERVAFSLVSQPEGVPVFGFEQMAFFSHDTLLLSYRNNLAQPLSRLTKIVFDLVVSAVLLVLLSGLMALIALLIRLDGGPALFAHERIGAGGRGFRCLKFRTMVTNSEMVLQDLLKRDPQARAQWAQTRKLTRDPRVTPIGRFLRATSIDELPQLFNVLRLEMSLVGPRPIVAQEIAHYSDDIAFYYATRPGLTGLWQVSGRSDTTYTRRVKLDSWYVRNWSVWHDIAIMLKTIPAVFSRHGAR
jgi:undecaprenyl-phosphate galactose phosphotransferase